MPDSPDLDSLTLSEAAALIAARTITPLELTQHCVARARSYDDDLNAFITAMYEPALQDAEDAMWEIAAGNHRGPLQGIPFGLKDLIETAEIRTTAGSPLRNDYVPEQDAYVVERLREAGIVLVGKLNLHEWALGTTNVNTYYPSPRNPWDRSRITGGSSGGSAVAVAAGYCLGALGTDTRGSIRIPASLCGVTGLKPTYGRVSLRGVVPLVWSLDHVGPMARTAADCALILDAVAGFDPLDPASADVPAPRFASFPDAGAGGLRIGLPRNYFFDPDAVDAGVLEAVEEAAREFERLGAVLVPIDFPEPADYDDGGAFLAEAAAYHEQRLQESADQFGLGVLARLQPALAVSGLDYVRARYRQLALRSALRSLFDDVDLVLTPTTPRTALPFPDDASAIPPGLLARNTAIFNLAGVPAISLPCGFDQDGLPVGLQLAGSWWSEGAVLRAAHAYQQATDWYRSRPDLG